MLESQQSFDLQEDEDELATLLENIDHLEQDPNLWPKTLNDLMAVVESRLDKINAKLDTHSVSRELIAAIAHYLGGRQVYLPRDDRLQRAMRDYRIFQRFNGTNHNELAAEYGLTTIQVYNILAKQKLLQRNRHQPSLFS